jgi:hypothetical protein
MITAHSLYKLPVLMAWLTSLGQVLSSLLARFWQAFAGFIRLFGPKRLAYRGVIR